MFRAVFHCVFHCAFHCVTQRRARFTVRFTAFHSAARISLQLQVCRDKFPISNAYKIFSGPVNLQPVCENHPSLERKACKRLTTSLLSPTLRDTATSWSKMQMPDNHEKQQLLFFFLYTMVQLLLGCSVLLH